MGNIIIDGGESSDERLLAGIERGFYIKEFWYIRLVRMEDLTLTGMTRNGFFYVEDGLIVSGATHFRWNNSPISLLNNLVDLGKQETNMPSYGRPSAIPSMVVNDFYLSSKTLF
jgi:predicted Zn-dependent protease